MALSDYMQILMQQQQQVQNEQLSQRQIDAQKEIAAQQNALNTQQFQYQQDLAKKQQDLVDAQAKRQTEYDTGRSGLLAAGTDQVNKAFSGFNDDYFNNFAGAYMAKAKDQVDQQKTIAQKNLAFGLARQGILDSQANANQQGLLAETEGRTLADETVNAQNQTNALRSGVAQSKANLLGQVQASESIGSPIAAADEGGVQAALQTQKSVISGVNNQSGDVVASLKGVPTVSPIANIFTNVLGSGGSFLSGVSANSFGSGFAQGQAGASGPQGGNKPFGRN